MNMTEEQFRDLVREMRTVQCRYFRTRDRAVLAESKALERRVDGELSGTAVVKDSTPSLFGGDA